tara:strand:- start:393 stop:3842 length:3450 start_codon:yes stop_codon:yes gene_type:complete
MTTKEKTQNSTKKPGNNEDGKKNPVLFEKLVSKYYKSEPYVKSMTLNNELEIKFGTKGVKPYTKVDYDNVIRKLKSLGFVSRYEEGYYLMRIGYEHLDKSGRFKDSTIRTELTGFRTIQEYCNTNDISKLLTNEQYMASVKFVKKTPLYENNEKVFDVNFNDFNFSVSYRKEEDYSASSLIVRGITQNWLQMKKTFRYINRVSFTHPDFPVNIDMSIVKSSHKEGYNMKKTYSTEESGVFHNPEVYEMEIELDNSRIGPGTEFNSVPDIMVALRKSIKYVLMGLQGTNFPVSVYEQKDTIQLYMKLIEGEKYVQKKYVNSKKFIGPSSYTLQMENIMPLNDDMNVPNIRKDYVVTDKADGERRLMFIDPTGKIYLISTNMDVIFTGAITENKVCFNSLFDGELILHNKNHQFINLFAVFDAYFMNGTDVRQERFMLDLDVDDEKTLYRYKIVNNMITLLQPISVIKGEISPMIFQAKKFYPETIRSSIDDGLPIFSGCKHILEKEKNGLFQYETDGLIFTHAYYGVGSNKIGKAGPLSKTTWDYSFKWKPPQFNTIDFLVTTVKSNGEDVITPIFQPGKSTSDLNQFKTIELRCGYNQKRHGYLNPCQDIYEDKLPEFEDKDDSFDYKPVLFVPSNPYDPEAGICNIMLKRDDTGVLQMFADDGIVFENNTIVEFRYEMNNEKKWRWVPIRVRNDKTTELRQGITMNFGNAYHVAESNWKSIHNPITDVMISSGQNITNIEVDEDVYYNRIVASKRMVGLRAFHNYIKSILIKCVSKKGDTLIDLACGKGGDFSKWTNAKLSFVLGIDKSPDNIENRVDGACARYLNFRKSHRYVPDSLFVIGDTSKNIRNGNAMKTEKGAQIVKAVFGEGGKDEKRLGKGIIKQYGKAASGFNVTSCQFALHYFFEDFSLLQNFVRNVAECTHLGGYFIATAYDGKLVFDMLKNKSLEDGVSIYEDGAKLWEIKKGYSLNSFEDDSSCCGYSIDVFQESINQPIQEYLVNYDYLRRIMEDYGLQVLNRDEANELGLPDGEGLFSDLFTSLSNKSSTQKREYEQYKDALNMNEYEKKISFLNKYIVYKKVRIVNTQKVILEEAEESEETLMRKEHNPEVLEVDDKVEIRTTKTEEKPKQVKKPRKLSKKLIIVDDTTTS